MKLKIDRHAPPGKSNIKRNVSVLSAGALFVIALTGCLSEQFNGTVDQGTSTAEVFNYETSVKTPLSLVIKDMQDKPVPGVSVDVYYEYPFDGSSIKAGVSSVMTLGSDATGTISSLLDVPNLVSTVYLVTKFPGYNNPVEVAPAKTGVSLVLHPAGYAAAALRSATVDDAFAPAVLSALGSNVYKMGDFSATGVPTYMVSTRDTVGTEFLARISSALPETKRVPVRSPQLLADPSRSNIKTKDACNIWVSFVSEGAAWHNAVGYFYYPSGSAPSTIAAINKRIIIYPNASATGSGGGLVQGDKVKLRYYDESTQQWTDVFPPNLTISWFLIADGFRSNTVSNGYYWNYSLPDLNSNNLQQTVMLFDKASSRIVIGFEDTQRNLAGTSGDEDFNDALFYATANPITAIDLEEINEIPKVVDTDGDGVPDVDDKYPTDPKRAYDASYSGTLAFEDHWPAKGDYDFNDLVADYSVTHVTNAQNKVVDIQAAFTIKAAGAEYQNGLAFQLGTTPGNIESLSGSRLYGSLFSVNSTGVENGQTKAVIPVVDNVFSLFNASMVNTIEGGVTLTAQTININLTLKTPVDLSTLGTPPYNSFLVVDQERGREVHLPGNLPTDLVNRALFGTKDDKTNPAVASTCYKANQSYPWALNISGSSFDYPVEKADIDQAHLKFSTWVTTLGVSAKDWYKGNSGYRNSTNIYTKK
jgi:hypothetical protein